MTTSDADAIAYKGKSTWEQLSALFRRVEVRPHHPCGRVQHMDNWKGNIELCDHDFWLAIRGSGEFRIHNRTYPIRPGTLFWLRPGDKTTFRQVGPERITVIFAHFGFYRKGTDQQVRVSPRHLPAQSIPLDDSSRIDPLLTRIVRLRHLPHPLGEIEMRLCLEQVMLEAYRQDATNRGGIQTEIDPRISRVITHIRTRPQDPLSLTGAAELAGLSPDYFSALFKDETGTSFRQYVPEVRLEHAKVLLKESTMSVTEVGRAVGYSDVFHFSRQFKVRFGISPSHLRKRQVNDD